LPQTLLSHASVQVLAHYGETADQAAARGADGSDALAVAEAVVDPYCVDVVFEGPAAAPGPAHVAGAQAHTLLPLPSIGVPTPPVSAGERRRTLAALAELVAAQHQWQRSGAHTHLRDDGELVVTGPLPWPNPTVRLVPLPPTTTSSSSSSSAYTPAATSAVAGPATRPPLSLAGVTLLYHRRAPTAVPMHTIRLVPEWRAAAVRRRYYGSGRSRDGL
jgi:hypothetical protein